MTSMTLLHRIMRRQNYYFPPGGRNRSNSGEGHNTCLTVMYRGYRDGSVTTPITAFIVTMVRL